MSRLLGDIHNQINPFQATYNILRILIILKVMYYYISHFSHIKVMDMFYSLFLMLYHNNVDKVKVN